MRYMSWNAFEALVTQKTLVLRNCAHYEHYDPLEGKPTEIYKRIVARAVKAESLAENPENLREDGFLSYQELVRDRFTILDIHRQFTFITCWTTAERETRRMWRTFALNGVLVKSTLGNVLDAMFEFQETGGFVHSSVPRYEILHAPVEYRRDKMHYRLDLKNYNSTEMPFFHIDNDPKSSHQQEYRIAIKDRVRIDKLEYSQRRSEVPNGPDHLPVNFDPALLLDVVFSSLELKRRGKDLLAKYGYNIPCSVSKISQKAFSKAEEILI